MHIADVAKKRVASIESTVVKPNINTSIEALPEEISSLIVGEAFRDARVNRYRMLIRQGYLQHLLELARYCRRTAIKNPAFMFAKYASKAKWERTVKWCEKLIEVARTAEEVAKRLAVSGSKAVYKAVWHLKSSVIPKAILADEIVSEKGGNRLRLFNYLCWKT